MDWKLLNHHEKCRFCFETFEGVKRFKITNEVNKKFLRLTQTELGRSKVYSKSICEECSRKLVEFSEYRKQLVESQERLKEFEQKLNPKVILQRLDDEPQIAIRNFDSTFCPLTGEVFCKIEEVQEVFVKTEIEDCEFDSIAPWTESIPMLMKTPEKVELRVKIKKNTQSSHAISQLKRKPNVVLEACKVVDCKYMIHPKLVAEHNRFFHLASKKDFKIPKNVPSGKICPYCAKLISSSSIHRHLTKHYQTAEAKYLHCDLCSYKTYVLMNMRAHMSYKHVARLKQGKRFHCDKCPYKSEFNQNLKVHVRRVHLKIIDEYTCNVCGKNYATPTSLNLHKQKEHELGDFPCSRCNEKFSTKPILKAHILKIHADKITCEVCGKLCPPGVYFSHHMKAHRLVTCPIEGCGRVSNKRKIKGHIELYHQPPENLPCPTCSTVFTKRERLKSHIRLQHTSVEMKCKVIGCLYGVRRKQYLREHYQRHQGISEVERNILIQHLNNTVGPTAYNETSVLTQLPSNFSLRSTRTD